MQSILKARMHMLDSKHQGRSASRMPVLNAGFLARIHELNRDYLDLLVCEHRSRSPGASPNGLPTGDLAELAALGPAARDLLAHCPYALYSLGFADHDFWQALSAASIEGSVEVRYGALDAGSVTSAFCETALFLAWHVATTNHLAAGMLYAMPGSVASMLAARPLWWLRRVAADYPGLLQPRWPTNRCFWPHLIRAAAQGDSRTLHTTRLLGTQLIAAELALPSPAARRISRLAPPARRPRE